ncbi:MAG: 23S rRNA (pseudouridine(1915)-N(3))-methyltransferase RlmH [Gammaproteobacteria bacterium]|nr:23S rRNA (pseudouridine(1915)-N(3))-methyltransferase RlmH [Gammaproteobacteria bacterium]
MRLHVIAVGKRLPAWAEQACSDYVKRVRGDCSLHVHAVTGSRRGGNDAGARVHEEGEALLKAVPRSALLVALAIEGDSWSTEQLAGRFDQWRSSERDVAFLIGGADGLSPRCREAARHSWSLSALTLPHALARVVVAEQLYRAWTLAHGHPYHH